MTINFTKDTFYEYNSTEGDYDSGYGWNQFKKILDESLAFNFYETKMSRTRLIELFDLRFNIIKGYVSYKKSYFDSKSIYHQE
jgi:hypothetical protein